VVCLAQNEMKARHATPLRVRLTDGLGGCERCAMPEAEKVLN